MDWVRLQPDLAPYVIHIANQRRTNVAYGALLKRMGVKAGVSDVFIALPRGEWHGAWVEFKSEGGKLTPQQTMWLDRMSSIGYCTFVAYSADMAIERVKEYLSGIG